MEVHARPSSEILPSRTLPSGVVIDASVMLPVATVTVTGAIGDTSAASADGTVMISGPGASEVGVGSVALARVPIGSGAVVASPPEADDVASPPEADDVAPTGEEAGAVTVVAGPPALLHAPTSNAAATRPITGLKVGVARPRRVFVRLM